MVLLALSLVAGCGAAFGGFGKREQQPKVVVLNVKGKKGKKVRGDIVELLQTKDYALVPKADYIKTARRLKAGKLRARHITKVSTELGLDAVISGRVKRRGKRRYLYVTVHDGASGARIERFRVRLTRKRTLTEDGARQLESKLMGALAEVKPASGGRDEVVAGDDDEDQDEELSPREKRRRAKEEARAERERKKAEARERKKAEAEARARAEREREAKEKREREARKREAAEIKEVANPETDDSGQAIDDEAPPGL